MRVVAASTDDVSVAAESAAEFPHLTIFADHEGSLIRSLGAFDKGTGPTDQPMAAPTVLLIDANARVRYVFRPDRFVERLNPDQLLAEARRVRGS